MVDQPKISEGTTPQNPQSKLFSMENRIKAIVLSKISPYPLTNCQCEPCIVLRYARKNRIDLRTHVF